MNIGIAIKKLRKSQRLSQKELADLCGLEQAALSLFENGTHRPNTASLKKLMDYFQIPEIVFIMLSVDIDDIPVKKRAEFERVYPNIQRIMLTLFQKELLKSEE